MPAQTKTKRKTRSANRKPTLVGKHLVVDPRVCHGALTFRGTRVPVATILSYVARGFSLAYLGKSWPEVSAKAIEEALFVFENLLDLDDKNLGTLIRNIDGEILTRALKGVDQSIRDRFLGCMSSRAADGIRDEMEARGPMKLSEVLEAQKAIIQIARTLAKDGTIQMGAGEDDYV